MCMHMGVGVGDVCVLESGFSVRVAVLVHYIKQYKIKYGCGKLKFLDKQKSTRDSILFFSRQVLLMTLWDGNGWMHSPICIV